jgi:hypothetical protein
MKRGTEYTDIFKIGPMLMYDLYKQIGLKRINNYHTISKDKYSISCLKILI